MFSKRILYVVALLCFVLNGKALAQRTLQWQRFNASTATFRTTAQLWRPGRYVSVNENEASNGRWRGLRLVFLTATGDTVRVVNHTQAAGSYFNASGLVVEPDGSLTVFGTHTQVNTGVPVDYTNFLMQLDSLGRIRWQRYYNPQNVAMPGGMLRLPDGYLLLANSAPYNNDGTMPVARLLRTDRQGNVLWQRSYPSRGQAGIGDLLDVTLCPDGSYLAVGFRDVYTTATTAYYRRNYYLVQLRPNGDTIRTATIGGSNDREDGQLIRPVPGGGYVMSGLQARAGTSLENGQVVRLDSLLRPQWTRTFPSPTYGHLLKFLIPLTNGSIITGGSLYQANRTWTGHLTELLPADGTSSWTETQQPGQYETLFDAAVADSAQNLLVGGFDTQNSSPRIGRSYYLRYSLAAPPFVPNPCVQAPQPEFAFYRPTPDSLVVLDISLPGPRYAVPAGWRWDFGDGSPAVEGRTLVRYRYAAPPDPNTPVKLTYTNSMGCTRTVVQYPFRPLPSRAAHEAGALQLYPNPIGADGRAVVELRGAQASAAPVRLTVYDALGRPLPVPVPLPATPNLLRWQLELAGQPAGLYLLRLQSAGGTTVQRLVKP